MLRSSQGRRTNADSWLRSEPCHGFSAYTVKSSPSLSIDSIQSWVEGRGGFEVAVCRPCEGEKLVKRNVSLRRTRALHMFKARLTILGLREYDDDLVTGSGGGARQVLTKSMQKFKAKKD